ncbi:MAG: hypothetical protein ACW96X_09925 [Promethearchaeota archaeon]|jgi:hypothetical protein
MAIFMATVWLPNSKVEEANKIAARFTNLPPYIKKWQILSAAGGSKGFKSYNIIYIDDDKYSEAQTYIAKLFNSYYEIEGYSLKVEPVLSQRDMVKVLQFEI